MAHELQFLFLHEITQEQPTGEVPKHDPISLLILFLDPPNRVCCKVLRNPVGSFAKAAHIRHDENCRSEAQQARDIYCF